MYFRQIEMTGFKSFADRTVLRLEPGITAVVGPNGCGKSNILDALRWALGEQRAKELRGSHMQDVIFNGSEDRQPMGMAEVSLTFDNADSQLPVDFAEVQVSRRVYRSGESEYLVNKAPCRRRDIQEMFMDTGIGTNAYSMIGQGKISLVLSSKPEDRRFLFEEAAGIIRYKARKRVAMRKLDSAEQNLLRLHDIVLEVERQMRSLKRQVNAAIRYRELSGELREIEIRAAWLKYQHLSEVVAQLKESFAAAQNSYESVNAETSKLEARHEELSLKRLEADRVVMARREGVHEIDSEMEKLERQIALLRQQIEFSKEQQEQAALECEEFRKRADALQGQQGETSARASKVEEEIAAMRGAIETKQAECDQVTGRLREAEEHVEAMRTRSVEALNERARTQTQLETLNVNVANLESQLEQIYQNQRTSGERQEVLVAEIEAVRKVETEKEAALAEREQKRGQAAETQSAKAADLDKTNDKWQDLREQKSSINARLTSLRELRDSYEGFATGVRAIMMAKQKEMGEVQGIIGPVGDLLSTEKTYERAVEAALGGNINNVVAEDAESVKGAIQFLRETRAGRVTFLPLDIIRASNRDDYDAIAGRPGVIGPAIDFVEFDPHIREAVEYLFHNCMLVETIDDAIRISRQERRHPRMVTLEGEVVSSSGAVTGGRTKHESRGLLGRSAEISELEEKLESVDNEIRGVLQRAQTLNAELEKLKEDITRLAREEVEIRRELNEAGVEIARRSTELENLNKSLESLNATRDGLCAQRDQFDTQRREARERATSMESDDEALQQAIAEAQDNASRVRQELSERASELSDLRVKMASLTESLESAQRDRQREQREYETAVREAERRVELGEQHKKNQARLEEDVKLNIERVKSFSENKEEAREKVVDAENERQAVLDETEQIDGALRDLRERSKTSQSDVHRLELELRQNEDRIGFFQERIMEEYNLALSQLTAEQVGEDEMESEARDKRVTELRDRLQRMGTVNLMAIEEYEALEERHDFLATQQEDLSKAREALLSVVDRIDVKIREMFLETFERVAQNFHSYFRRLFNGGQARVYLLDEDDPLESGIEIEARPPGKKPQSISLLSGGEQAMTAIALLFSIFKAKPSPFCVLDEVDAPLDDANIGRFLDIVDEFTDESQFIVITHSKQTMARANVLYGVTQQERGVSQIVSAKMDEGQDTESAA